MHVCSVSLTLWDPMDCTCQVPLSMQFARQEYRSGLPFPSTEDLPDPSIERTSPASPVSAGEFFTTEPPGKPITNNTVLYIRKLCRESILPGEKQIVTVWCDACSPVISQYIHMSNHCFTPKTNTMLYVNYSSTWGKYSKKRITTNFKTTRTLLEGPRSTEKN